MSLKVKFRAFVDELPRSTRADGDSPPGSVIAQGQDMGLGSVRGVSSPLQMGGDLEMGAVGADDDGYSDDGVDETPTQAVAATTASTTAAIQKKSQAHSIQVGTRAVSHSV